MNFNNTKTKINRKTLQTKTDDITGSRSKNDQQQNKSKENAATMKRNKRKNATNSKNSSEVLLATGGAVQENRI